jgi:hypothetical protein
MQNVANQECGWRFGAILGLCVRLVTNLRGRKRFATFCRSTDARGRSEARKAGGGVFKARRFIACTRRGGADDDYALSSCPRVGSQMAGRSVTMSARSTRVVRTGGAIVLGPEPFRATSISGTAPAPNSSATGRGRPW